MKKTMFFISFLLCCISSVIVIISPVLELNTEEVSQFLDESDQTETEKKENQQKSEKELYSQCFKNKNFIVSSYRVQNSNNIQRYIQDGFAFELFKPPSIS